MASLSDLAAFGRALMFGSLTPVPPATFSVPAGDPVMVGSNRAEQWQNDAWRLWKWVGELHYPTTRLSRQTSQLEWRVRVNGRQLTPESAKREMEIITAGMGPQEATYLLALNDQVAGEAWYIEESDGEFTVWSVVEKDLDKKIENARAAGRLAIRMHQPDPTNTSKADSSVRTAIGPAEEVLTLQALSESQARSRTSQAGVLITPAEQLYAAEDPWEQNLVDALSASIKDVRSPAALAPIHIRMRRDLIEMVRYLTFPRPYDDLVDRKIERAVVRIASALDIEPELIQGQGDATYWNAWAISMDTYQAHIAPRADRIGNLYADISERLRARMDQNDVVEITPDPRVMLARRSTIRDALDALRNGAVGFAFLRDAIGATEADAPTEEELEIILALAGRSMDRERRVGENPGPARSSPENSGSETTDFQVAEHARRELGKKLQDAWRNTPHRNRLNGVEYQEVGCYIPLSDIGREMPVAEVIRDAVKEVATADEVDRLASWIMDTLTKPMTALRALEEIDA